MFWQGYAAMHLGEIIATYDLGLALRGESGKFEVTSPTGEVYHVTCKPNHSISSLEWAGNRNNPQPFLIRKMTETISLESGKEATATQARTGGTPFLLDSQPDDGEPLFATGKLAALPKTTGANSLRWEAAGLDLVYLENAQETGQLSAWVSVRSERNSRTGEPETSMTARCTTFNELDAEIRKLHARLDDIRSRARKKFYMAHAPAATA